MMGNQVFIAQHVKHFKGGNFSSSGLNIQHERFLFIDIILKRNKKDFVEEKPRVDVCLWSF